MLAYYTLLSTADGDCYRRFRKLCLAVGIGYNQLKLIGYGLGNGLSEVGVMLE